MGPFVGVDSICDRSSIIFISDLLHVNVKFANLSDTIMTDLTEGFIGITTNLHLAYTAVFMYTDINNMCQSIGL